MCRGRHHSPSPRRSSQRQQRPRPHPLHFASKGGHLEVVKILVERQANVNAKAKDTSVAFGVTPLHWACQHGRANVADFLLRHGARMDILDQRNRSVLHAASEGGDVQLIRMLLSLGADVSARDIDGLRPIHLAAKARKTMALEFYVQDYPELVNVQTDTGLTPLGVASQQGHKDLVTLLLSLSEGNGD
ncbi:hypothetical protein BaRGS_00028831 [Batillaria attramentaria]|uniref:Uncharacterized protein n=1 Tax=Batillaria attramentaria TaxID=370345 RepID=A0ABD0JZC9_9CAEN